jgi:hypothetical protein
MKKKKKTKKKKKSIFLLSVRLSVCLAGVLNIFPMALAAAAAAVWVTGRRNRRLSDKLAVCL